jgi:hypothetical protein
MAKGEGEGKSPFMRVLTVGGIVVSLSAGVLGLLFTIEPKLKPCIGSTEASFTDAPVFPRANYRDYLIRRGERKEVAAREPLILGAEVRFSYRAEGLRGHDLPLTYTLLRVGRDGTLGAVVEGEDRALDEPIRPTGCSDTGGRDLFVNVPDAGKRYRIVLELFRDADRTDRLALAQSEIFIG